MSKWFAVAGECGSSAHSQSNGPRCDGVGQSGCHAVARTVPVAQREATVRDLTAEPPISATGPLERLTGRIAHDFNNLLSVVTSSAELLRAQLESKDIPLEPLREILLAAQQGAELVELLTAFGRQQFLQPMVIDLNDQVVQLTEELQSIVGDRVRLQLTLGSEPACARVDPAQFRRIMLNLAYNSCEAMPTGGTLSIDVETVEVTGFERTGEITSCVMIAVSDTGLGMSERVRAQAFEPFFTTKQGGTGMGLASVRGIVAQSGGAIWLDSVPNEGTTVAIYFPSVTSVPTGTRKRTLESQPARPAQATQILLVDDDAAVRRAIGRLLRADGFAVTQAGSPSEALEVARVHAHRIDLVLTDVVMPEMSGVQLADRLKELIPAVPVLFMSGHPAAALADPDQASRCVPFVRKPVGKTELLAAILSALTDASRAAECVEGGSTAMAG
jgi:two-component system cell cycle sensor histidine kinase/response regulator CckA